MIKFAIVDDQKHYIEKVRTCLADCMADKEYETAEFTDCNCFLAAMEKMRFEIVFLDIVFEKENGIELGKVLNEKYSDTVIIFMSAYEEYFKDVYKVKHSYFLIKEFEKDRFSDAVEKALEIVTRNFVCIHEKNEIHRVNLKELIYVESSLKHTKFFMNDRSCMEFNVNIKKVEEMLPGNLFVRVHQSFIINMDCIVRFNKQNIFMCNGAEIPISRARASAAKEKILFFMGGVL